MFNQGLSLDQAPPISVPFRFFLTAPIFGVVISFVFLFFPFSETSNQKAMRLDVFIKSENSCWVIDSKYYTATGAHNAPGWSDLVKQFFYVKAVKLIYPELESIKNIFIFPGITNPLSTIQMVYREESEKLEKLTEDFHPIECLYLDPNYVMEKYLKSEKVYITDYI